MILNCSRSEEKLVNRDETNLLRTSKTIQEISMQIREDKAQHISSELEQDSGQYTGSFTLVKNLKCHRRVPTKSSTVAGNTISARNKNFDISNWITHNCTV